MPDESNQNPMMKAADYIHQLGMQKHPEGGYFVETYRSDTMVQSPIGDRTAGTVIYFMLLKDFFSAFHRLRSDETWYYHAGSSTSVHCLHPDGTLNTIIIGPNLHHGEALQIHIPSGTWFSAEVTGEGEFILVSCSVSPGFEFADFELASRAVLTELYPQHMALIHRLTRQA